MTFLRPLSIVCSSIEVFRALSLHSLNACSTFGKHFLCRLTRTKTSCAMCASCGAVSERSLVDSISISCFKWRQTFDPRNFQDLTKTLAAVGCNNALEYCLSENVEKKKYCLIEVAAKNGQTGTLEFLSHRIGIPLSSCAAASAALNGHLETLMYLHDMRCPWDEWASASAAECGQIDVLSYLHQFSFC